MTPFDNEKRNVSFNGKRSSITLEKVFWEAIDKIAASQSLDAESLLMIYKEEIPPKSNFSSYVRCRVSQELLESMTFIDDLL